MRAEELEPELEALLHRVVPDLMNWQGSSEADIDKVEQVLSNISGLHIPKFYRWFLMRMGHSMGDLGFEDMDYSASSVLTWYEEGIEDDGAKFFKIGHSSESEMELHMYYDFNFPARDDARVTMRQAEGGEDYGQFDTFREMLATRVAQIHAIRLPIFCTGTMVGNEDILPALEPVLEASGFAKSSIPAGDRCGIFEGQDVILITTGSMDIGLQSCGFVLGGQEANDVRLILGAIDSETDFLLDVNNDPRHL